MKVLKMFTCFASAVPIAEKITDVLGKSQCGGFTVFEKVVCTGFSVKYADRREVYTGLQTVKKLRLQSFPCVRDTCPSGARRGHFSS